MEQERTVAKNSTFNVFRRPGRANLQGKNPRDKVFFLQEVIATRNFLNSLRGNGGNVIVWTNGLPGYVHLLPSHLHHL